MDGKEAEKIINAYGGAIANDQNKFKKKSSLPCSIAKIRQAFFAYIPAIIENYGSLPDSIGQSLVSTYSMLDIFISDEEADRLNSAWDKVSSGQLKAENPEDKKLIDECFSLFSSSFRNGRYFDEINEFIDECYKEKGIRVIK